MGIYEFSWKAFGTIEVRADNEPEAQEIANSALFSMHDIDAEEIKVDGVDLEVN